VILCATGVTNGPLLHGVSFDRLVITTETVVYHSYTGTCDAFAPNITRTGCRLVPARRPLIP